MGRREKVVCAMIRSCGVQGTLRSLIVTVAVFNDLLLAQFANRFAFTCSREVNPLHLPPVTNDLVVRTSSNAFFLDSIRRPGTMPVAVRVLESTLVCEGISSQENTFQSVSYVLRIECQYCQDSKVTNGTRNPNEFYEYSVQISAYCSRTRENFGSLEMLETTEHTFRYNDYDAGRETSIQVAPRVVIGPPLKSVPPLSRQCSVCAARLPLAIPDLDYDENTWCYSCLDACVDGDGVYDCISGLATDCCIAYSPVSGLPDDLLFCRSTCSGNDIDFNNLCRERAFCSNEPLLTAAGIQILQLIPAGTIEINSYREEAVARVQCAPHYKQRMGEIVCTNEGIWSPDPTTFCGKVDCGVPRLPLNASRNFSQTTEGAIATFVCDRHFLPTVERSSMCLRSGDWSPPPESHTCIFDDRRTPLVDTTTGRLLAAITPVSGYVYGILLILGVLLAYAVGQRSRRVRPEVHTPIQESHNEEQTDEEVSLPETEEMEDVGFIDVEGIELEDIGEKDENGSEKEQTGSSSSSFYSKV